MYGKPDQALIEFQKALKINPKYTKTQKNLKALCQIIKNLPKDPKTQISCPKI
jgi:hypothetical protein